MKKQQSNSSFQLSQNKMNKTIQFTEEDLDIEDPTLKMGQVIGNAPLKLDYNNIPKKVQQQYKEEFLPIKKQMTMALKSKQTFRSQSNLATKLPLIGQKDESKIGPEQS